MDSLASLETDMPPRRELTLADLGHTIWDFFNKPYRAPDENRIAGGQPPRLGIADHLVSQAVKNLVTLPQRALESSARHAATGEYDPAPILEAATVAATSGIPFTVRGAIGSAGSRPTTGLLRDEASRMQRADVMRYESTPFYRGDRDGVVRDRFPRGAFFSSDKGYAGGIAKKGGRDAPEEYRLNLQKAFKDYAPVTAEAYARLIVAARASDPKLAAQLVADVAPGKSIDWFIGFARQSPSMTVAETGAPVRLFIEKNSRGANDLLLRAGFDSVAMTGGDVLKLTGAGIRSKNAMFDPERANDYDIMASLPPLAIGTAGAGSLAASYPNQD